MHRMCLLAILNPNKPVDTAVKNLFNDTALIFGEKTSWGGGTMWHRLRLSSPEWLSQMFTLVSQDAVTSNALSGENLHPTMFDKWPVQSEYCITNLHLVKISKIEATRSYLTYKVY